MRRALAFLALIILTASGAACGGGDNTNASPRIPVRTDRITVRHPDIFLQGDPNGWGKVTFEVEEVSGEVRRSSNSNGNTTEHIDRPLIRILPDDTALYNTYVEVRLIPDGLKVINSTESRRPYTGSKQVWEWGLEPDAGKKDGDPVSIRFQVSVTREGKTPDVKTEVFPDIWPDSKFSARVGLPALMVDAAFYGSPLFAIGGIFSFGSGVKRRRGQPGAEEEEEEVSSTVYAPSEAAPGDGFLVQVFVHLPEQAGALDELAKEADEDARRRVSVKLQKRIKRGAELAFYLLMPGLEVDSPAQSCVWVGEPAWVQFGVTVPEGCKPRDIIGTVTVSENSVPIGHLKFKFKVKSDASVAWQAPSPEPAGQMVRYRQAFISYASEDRPEVLKRVQMLNLAKIKFFQDLLSLEPGQAWEKLLYDYIDKSDVFFLFWSAAASRSEWVRREVEYAIKTGGDDEGPRPEIIPVLIEGPPPASPPPALSSLHFNDKLLYFIGAGRPAEKPLDG